MPLEPIYCKKCGQFVNCKKCGQLVDYTTCIDCERIVPFCRNCRDAGEHTNHRLMVYEYDGEFGD